MPTWEAAFLTVVSFVLACVLQAVTVGSDVSPWWTIVLWFIIDIALAAIVTRKK